LAYIALPLHSARLGVDSNGSAAGSADHAIESQGGGRNGGAGMKQPTKRGFVAGLIVTALVVVSVMVAASAVGASPKAATASELFHGPIEKVDTTHHRFKMNDLLAHGGKGRTRTIKATNATSYQHLSGFDALHKGLNVDVTSHEEDGLTWTADKIKKAPAGPIGSGVTIHFRQPKKFVGFVFSQDPRICASGRPVKVYRQKGKKQRPGRDVQIQKRTFASKAPNGKYKWVIHALPGPGKYYARILAFADCQKDSSKTIHAP
jgi:hypothetical protein